MFAFQIQFQINYNGHYQLMVVNTLFIFYMIYYITESSRQNLLIEMTQ